MRDGHLERKCELFWFDKSESIEKSPVNPLILYIPKILLKRGIASSVNSNPLLRQDIFMNDRFQVALDRVAQEHLISGGITSHWAGDTRGKWSPKSREKMRTENKDRIIGKHKWKQSYLCRSKQLVRTEVEVIWNWEDTHWDNPWQGGGSAPNGDFADEQNPRFSGKIPQWVLGSGRCWVVGPNKCGAVEREWDVRCEEDKGLTGRRHPVAARLKTKSLARLGGRRAVDTNQTIFATLLQNRIAFCLRKSENSPQKT